MNYFFVLLVAVTSFNCVSSRVATLDTSVLIGKWQLDMTPENPGDANFASMEIRSVGDGSFEGFFYRDGVRIRDGRLNTQTGVISGALVSGDNSGTYNSTFYYKDGVLHGSTHAIGRDFLSVWTAIKI